MENILMKPPGEEETEEELINILTAMIAVAKKLAENLNYHMEVDKDVKNERTVIGALCPHRMR